jgi:hypothetical protein
MERENQRKKKQVIREKYEENLCGNFELLYPYVSYAEEDFVSR